jgi:long-chain acyl-CoA synthetase
VYGDSIQAYLVGVAVANSEAVRAFATKVGLDPHTETKTIISRPDFNKQLIDEITAKAKEFQLSGLERIRKLHIIDYTFTVENELMTPTFKVKRANAKKRFIAELDELYS